MKVSIVDGKGVGVKILEPVECGRFVRACILAAPNYDRFVNMQESLSQEQKLYDEKSDMQCAQFQEVLAP